MIDDALITTCCYSGLYNRTLLTIHLILTLALCPRCPYDVDDCDGAYQIQDGLHALTFHCSCMLLSYGKLHNIYVYVFMYVSAQQCMYVVQEYMSLYMYPQKEIAPLSPPLPPPLSSCFFPPRIHPPTPNNYSDRNNSSHTASHSDPTPTPHSPPPPYRTSSSYYTGSQSTCTAHPCCTAARTFRLSCP